MTDAPKPSRDEKKARTRAALLDAARDLIARHGVDATSLDQIAEYAGFTKGAVYSNFSGKNDLLVALSDSAETTIDAREIIDSTAALADQLSELGRVVAREGHQLSGNQWRLQLEIIQYAIRNPTFRDRMHDDAVGLRADEIGWLAAAAERSGDRLALAPDRSLTVLSALSLGLVLHQALDPDSVPDELFAEAFALLAGQPRPDDSPAGD